MDAIKPRVGQALHGDNIKNGDIIRQNLIQPEQQIEIPLLLYIYMEEELAGMHLRVGTPTADDINRYF